MNILIIPSWYPTKNNIVSGIFVKEQVKALNKIGTTVCVFFPYDNTVEKGKIIFNYEDNIPVYRANSYYGLNSKVALLKSLFLSIKLMRFIDKKEKFDIIHAHVCYPAGYIANFYSKIHNKKYVITEHMSGIRSFSQKFYNKILLKGAYKKASNVITVSNSLKKELMDLGYKAKYSVLPNIVDMELFDYSKLNSLFNDTNKGAKALFIGSMAEGDVKGLEYLIPAIRELVKSKPNFTITLIGDGVNRTKYEELTKDMGIEKHFNFVGVKDKKNIPEIIIEHQFLVLPSRKETFGCVLIEAMSLGKPVLTTKCGGPEEFVTNDVGIVVEKENVQSLYDGLIEMINKYKNYDSQKIVEYTHNNFSYIHIGKKLEELYLKILDEN